MDYLGLKRLTDIVDKFANNSDLELEVRFMKDHVPDIGIGAYNKIKSYILRHTNTKEVSDVNIFMKVRSIQISGKDIEYMKKERISNVDLEGIGVRISLSSEIPITEHEAGVLVDNSEVITRHRERYSMMYSGVRIDLTKVLQSGKYVTYELELECVSRTDIVTRLNKCYELIFGLMNDSSLVYTTDEASNLIEFVNKSLLDFNDIKTRNLFPESEVRSKISYYPFPRPRNIKHEDLKYSGIVGGKEGYSWTYKADGEHKVLVFDKMGTWFIHAPNFITLLDRDNYGLEGLMLEGELIPESKRKVVGGRRFLFYVYDCIGIPEHGNVIQSEPLTVRMEYAQGYCDMIRDENILQDMTINTKSYIGLTYDNFFITLKEALDNIDKVDYETDGLIFVPNVGPYNSYSGSLLYDERVLSKHPDIVKWKPLDKITIDFLIKESGEHYELYVNDFKGQTIFSRKPTIDKKDIDQELSDGMIVELGFEDGKPILHRIRDDKVLPNSKEVAEITYKDILNPISSDMLCGRGFKLVRAYHNEIKKNLFNYATSKGHKVLLDLGSGRGGDIGKWRNFDKIFAVEPNEDNIEELKRRLPVYGMDNRVTIIKAGAQDTDIIKTEMKKHGYSAVSCIASMLSLTFLWEGGSVNQGLLSTLSELLTDDGHFIYLVMDSDHVTELFRPLFKTRDVSLNKVDFGSATLEWRDNSKIHVHVDDSIVTEQDEWLVKLDDLTIGLRNFVQEKRVRADKELLLPFNERMFSSLFTYGAYQKRKTSPTTTYPKPYPSRFPKIDYDNMTVEGDNDIYLLGCKWYSGTLAGITTIGDGSCFFHSVIKCINPGYFNMSLQEKLDNAYGLRYDIADALKDTDNNGITYYSYTAASQFQNVSPMYKLDNLTSLIYNPKEPVGDYIYGIFSTLYPYDIVVLEYRNEQLIVHSDTINPTDNIEKEVLFLVAYDGHFESLVEYNQDSQESPYTFTFKRNSGLVRSYIEQKKRK